MFCELLNIVLISLGGNSFFEGAVKCRGIRNREDLMKFKNKSLKIII